MLAALLLCLSGYAEDCPQKPNLGEHLWKYTGVYKNHAYGYGTRVPAGLTGLDNADTGYQHGFVLVIASGGGTVWVSGDVNSLDYRDARKAAEFDLRILKETAEQVSAPRYLPEQLGGHAAERMVAEFRCKGNSELYGHESISVVRGRFVYSLAWNGPASGTARGEQVLRELVSAWRFLQAR